MYNLKKVIASICVIAMMLTTVAFGATFADVAEDSAYYEAVETLNKLGIIDGFEDGTYKPEDGVTRAQMAKLIAAIQGYVDSAAAQTATEFNDVTAAHWASGYVATAAGMGIINGYGDGTFGPEDPVLFEQAVKMVMATLGYTAYAEYNGGYPGGYMAAAQRYNVTAGVSNATMGTQANRGTIAQLLANAIDTPLMEQTGWNTKGEVDYVICDGKGGRDYKTLMSENLGVVKIRGIVTENFFTALNNEEKAINLEEDVTVEIAIADAYGTTNKDFEDYNELGYDDAVPVTFLAGESDAADFLGKSVIAYAREVDDEYEIVSIVEDTTRNDVLEMDLSQFKQINAETGKFEYYKTATAKTATAVVIDAPAVVYNNVGDFEVADIFGDEVANEGATLDGGKITLIDNDDTKGYDVIFVEVAETAVVDEAEAGYVAFKEATATNSIMELEVDEDDTDMVVLVEKDGEFIDLADLAEWDVLSIIAAGSDAAYILAEVVSNKVVGTIASESKSATSAGGKAYRIEGTKYDVANGAYGLPIAVGDAGTFYINKYGKIAAFNEGEGDVVSASANYAYVTAVAEDEDILTGKKTAIFQMVTADGVVTLNLKASGAKLDGVGVNADDDMDALEALEGEIVKYAKNAANNITLIDTTAEFAEAGGVVNEDGEYDSEDLRFVGDATFFVDADSYVFFIAAEAEDSYLGTVEDLADGETYKVLAKYADKKADDNNIIVVEAVEGKAGKKAGFAVITAVGTSANEDGETILSVEAIVNGEEVVADTTYAVYDAVATKEVTVVDENGDPVEDEDGNEITEDVPYLTVGDIVKVKVANDLFTAIEVVYDFEDGVRARYDEDADLDAYAVVFDEVYTATGDEEIAGGVVTDYRKTSTTATIAGEDYKLSQAANVIIIDANGRKIDIKKGSVSNFKYFEKLYTEATVDVTIGDVDYENADAEDAQLAADFIFARKYDGRVTDVVIVKGIEDMKVR